MIGGEETGLDTHLNISSNPLLMGISLGGLWFFPRIHSLLASLTRKEKLERRREFTTEAQRGSAAMW
jgi:hypothetical protein